MRKETLMMVALDERKMRHPQPADRLKVLTTADARVYTVVNQHRNSTNTVTLGQSTSGQRIGKCTCKDFQNIHMHGMQCKHLRVAAGLHLARNKAKMVVARAATTLALSTINASA